MARPQKAMFDFIYEVRLLSGSRPNDFFYSRGGQLIELNLFRYLSIQITVIDTRKTHIDEKSLVDGLRQKSQAALDYLYDHYSGALYGVIFRVIRNDDMAKEVLQDTFLKIWNGIARYDPEKGKLFTWMLNIARHQAIDRTRSGEFSRHQKTGSLEFIVDGETDPETEKETDRIGVPEMLGTLPEEQRIVVEMLYFKGYTQSEMAEEFNLPLGTVKTRLRLALKHLRNRIRQI